MTEETLHSLVFLYTHNDIKFKVWHVMQTGNTCVFYLEEVNRYPLIPPKVDRATEIGITQENIPSSFSPNVWNNTTSEIIQIIYFYWVFFFFTKKTQCAF